MGQAPRDAATRHARPAGRAGPNRNHVALFTTMVTKSSSRWDPRGEGIMKTTKWGAGLLFLLVSHLLTGQETEEPTKAPKADDLAEKLEQMRDDYQELSAECWGKSYYLREPDRQV